MSKVKRHCYCCCIVGLFCASAMAQDGELYFTTAKPGDGGDLTVNIPPGGGQVCVTVMARSLTGADFDSLGSEVRFAREAAFSGTGTCVANCGTSAINTNNDFDCDNWGIALNNPGPDDCIADPVHYVRGTLDPDFLCTVPTNVPPDGLYIGEVCYDISADACGSAVISAVGDPNFMLGDEFGDPLPNGTVFRTLTVNVAPVNDDCASAEPIVANGSFPYNTACATEEAPVQCDGGTDNGLACSVNTDCSTAGLCDIGGTDLCLEGLNVDLMCVLDSDCPIECVADDPCGTGRFAGDVWFEATVCAGDLTVLATGGVDVAVYKPGVACPPSPTDADLAGCDNGIPGVTVAAVSDDDVLLIRLGTDDGSSRSGMLILSGVDDRVGCCLADGTCVEALCPGVCTGLGGTPLPPGEDCPTVQITVQVRESGGTVTHTFEVPADCRDAFGGSVARAGGCPPGNFIDAWESPANPLMCHLFGVAGSPPIPADFFGPGSDPFTGSVCLEGVPLGVTPFGEFGDADTLIQRESDPFDRCDPLSGPVATVAIEIVALSLVSVDPITVTFNGGQNPEQWDVAVDLSSVAPPAGTLTAAKTHCNGGEYISTLNVQPRFSFTRAVPPGGPLVLDTGVEGIDPVTLVQDDPIAWVSDVEPFLGAAVDPCSDFHPGIEQLATITDCECCIGDDCPDPDVCNCDVVCFGGACAVTPRQYGDVDCDGDIDLFDLFCILNGFSGDFSVCSFADDDLEPCEGDGDIDLFDLFAVLNAFSGANPCNCPAGP